jgi:spore coat protein U-like protein
MKNNKIIFSLMMLTAVGNAFALEVNGNLNLLTEVDQVCKLETENMPFGIYDANAEEDMYQSKNISLTCSDRTLYSLEILMPDAGTGTFKMSNTTNTNVSDKLNYDLYWQDWSLNEFHTPLVVTGQSTVNLEGVTTKRHPIQGKLFAGQYAAPGHYSQSVTIQVSY